jgi:predicted nuclease of predicted toxin-antitoxin system
MIAIQADEHIPQEVVTGLNARGIEAYSAHHEGLSGASDRELFEYAQRKNRIILTNDPDFFPLLEEGQHYGILYLTTQRAPAGRIIRDTVRLIDTSRPEAFENNVFYIPQNP